MELSLVEVLLSPASTVDDSCFSLKLVDEVSMASDIFVHYRQTSGGKNRVLSVACWLDDRRFLNLSSADPVQDCVTDCGLGYETDHETDWTVGA